MSEEVKAAREAAAAVVLALARKETFDDIYDDDAALFANAAIDAYEAALSRSHVRVPREPTEAMIANGEQLVSHFEGEYGDYNVYYRDDQLREVYRAMLAAGEK